MEIQNVSGTTVGKENETPTKKVLWSRNGILRLINLYAKHEEKFKSSIIKNDTVYRIISEELQSEGYGFSAIQCRDKFKYLKLKYMKKIDNMKSTHTGEEKLVFDYFKEMDEIFGKKPNTKPVAIACSSTGWKEGKVSNLLISRRM